MESLITKIKKNNFGYILNKFKKDFLNKFKKVICCHLLFLTFFILFYTIFFKTYDYILYFFYLLL